MLTLGSPRTDARLLPHVRRRARCARRLWEAPDAYHAYLRRQLHWLLESAVAPSGFYEPASYEASLRASDPLQAFHDIPLLTKARLREMAASVSARSRRRARFDADTSGTTGVPMRMVFGIEHFLSYFGRFHSLLERHRLAPVPGSTSMITVSVFPHCEDYCLLQTAASNTFYHRININLRYWRSPADVVACIAREDPMIIRGMPTSLEVLIEYIDRHPPATPIRPALVVVYAETLLPPTRHRLQVAFGAPVIDEYGLTEVGGAVAQECATQDGFHVLALDYYVEVVDGSGTPVPDGKEGLVVVTNLYARLVPVLRYCTEDYAIMTRDACRCGSSIPRLRRLTGRALTRFVRPDGSTFNPFDALGSYLLRLPVSQFQLVQRPGHRFVLRYRADADISQLDDVRALSSTLMRVYGRPADVSIEKVERFASDRKFQAFVRDETGEAG